VTPDGGAGERAVGYGVVLRHREFAALLGARVLSDWGDHVARVAIAALMLQASGSVTLSAATFAVSWLPSVFGQALLGPYADRFPRRGLLVVCDLLRAGLVAALLAAFVVDLPLALLLALLFLVELAGAPFYAATMAMLPDLFGDHREFMTAHALLRVVGQSNQVVGLAVGGIVVAAVQVTGALMLDIATFVLSAIVLLLLIRPRPAAAAGTGLGGLWEDVRLGGAHLRGDLPLRSLMLLACAMSMVFVAPEAVALAYAHEQGAATRVGGLLLAAPPLGAVAGAWLVGRWHWQAQVRRILPMAVGASVPLLLMALEPPWPVALALFVVSGACGSFMVPLLSTFTLLAPKHLRGRLNGLAGAGFSAATVAAYLLVGVVADLTSPAFSVTVAGAACCAVLAVLWPGWPRREIRRASAAAFEG
jgi:MFS family permease